MQVVSRGTMTRRWNRGLFHVEHFWFPPEPVRREGMLPFFRKIVPRGTLSKVTRVDQQGNTRFRPARHPPRPLSDLLCPEQSRSLPARCLAIRQFLIAAGSAFLVETSIRKALSGDMAKPAGERDSLAPRFAESP